MSGEVMRAQRSQRGKEDVLTKCPQILYAAVQTYTDLQKLVRLLLVTSIVRQRVDRVCIDGYISVIWKPALNQLNLHLIKKTELGKISGTDICCSLLKTRITVIWSWESKRSLCLWNASINKDSRWNTQLKFEWTY